MDIIADTAVVLQEQHGDPGGGAGGGCGHVPGAAIRGQPREGDVNPRPQAPERAIMCFSPAGACLMCGRKLVDEIFRFCSLGCKVHTRT